LKGIKSFFEKQKRVNEIIVNPFTCGREGIQTPNLLIRSQMLYSVELRNHFALKSGAKIDKI
jgi:hypothetical protein